MPLPEVPPVRAEPPISLLRLALIFARIGCLSFGGGGATLAMMHTEFCVRRRVVPEDEFQVLFGLSRIVPGMNLLSLTVLLGHRSHGLAGALVALAALTVPSFTVIILGCWLFEGGHPNPYLLGAVRGLGPAAAALLLHTGWQLCRGSLRKGPVLTRGLWLGLLAIGAVLAASRLVHTGWIVLAGGLVGALAARWNLAAEQSP